MDKAPIISINMPVYNGAKYLAQAIESILNQTYTEFEFIIINDGSTDNSVEIIKSYNDSRIKLYQNNRNYGLAYTRNRAVEKSSGKYIAILDCDDIAYPERLEKQVSFLETHRSYAMVGSWADVIDANTNPCKEVMRYTLSDDLIKTQLFFSNYFAQSAIMIRRDVFFTFKYHEDFIQAEDYFLFSQIAMKYQVANLQESLIKYRYHAASISNQKKKQMEECEKKVSEFHLRNIMDQNLTTQELSLHYQLLYNKINYSTITKKETWKILCWIKKLLIQNNKHKTYNPEYFNDIIKKHWNRYFHLWSSYEHGLKAIPLIWFSLNNHIAFKTKIHFILRCFKSEIKNSICQK